MIPHPLTLLFCWLIGKGLTGAFGYVLEFAGELCVDAVRYGWAGEGFLPAARLVAGGTWTFASALFVGAAVRLLAERSRLKAAGWAVLLCLFAAVFGAPVPLRLYAAYGFTLLTSPTFLGLTLGGAFLGSWLCERHHDRLAGIEAVLRGWMFWERGGGL